LLVEFYCWLGFRLILYLQIGGRLIHVQRKV
jgi:hypothetical protein